jgi:hypothetical protein
MKKTMLLAAAALMSMCGGAMAGGSGTVTVQLTNFCDEYTLTNSGALYAIYGVNSDCDPGIGGGTAGKVKKLGKLVTTGMILNASSTIQYVWTFSSPLSKGGTATLYDTTDGMTLNYVTSSPFTVVTGARKNANLPPATQAARN